ncbi:ribonuclease HII [Micromonosporaceae bacterium DT55]|uniref:ribonuclease HII n=1 Tax=Melissospora conviva TaxID=3388432 RepID=UPI003C22AE83
MLTPPRTVVRREGGLYALERALQRRGFRHVAGADEAGRGACAGPLVAAAAILPEGRRGEIEELADSKLLTPAARDRVYDAVRERALAYAVVVIGAEEVDGRGLHVCNLTAMRRALASLTPGPDYVLTDGFGVDGLGVPGLAVWKGDQVAACVAAASVLAKVTRDRLMVELDGRFPGYGFAEHKGYITADHSAALRERGPCEEHRFSYVNVAQVSGRAGLPPRERRPAPEQVGREPVERSRPSEGTVGVALGEPARQSLPVGEDVFMEGGVR